MSRLRTLRSRNKGEERRRAVLRIQGRGRARVEVGVRRRQASHDNGPDLRLGGFMVEGIIGVFGKYC
jgi:hypothetical protein